MSKAAKSKKTLPSAPYEPTEREAAVGALMLARQNRTIPAPKVRLEENPEGAPILVIEHPDTATGQVLLAEAVGAAQWHFAWDLIQQLAMMYVTSSDPSTYKRLSSALETIKGLQPRDETEALMAVQMTAIHRSLAQWVARAEKMTRLDQLEAADRAINRLARTYAAQMEALKRYRSSGQQKVTVEHVNVHAGGKAVVGNVGVLPQGDLSGAAPRDRSRHLASEG